VLETLKPSRHGELCAAARTAVDVQVVLLEPRDVVTGGETHWTRNGWRRVAVVCHANL